jgi:16S rRNA (cytosine1402-N4)-methyltransferase
MLGPTHAPVMLREVLEVLRPTDGAIYVDATFGGGGYARALLDAARCAVFGIDRDPDALAAAGELGRRYAGRIRVMRGRFGDMVELLAGAGVERVDGIAFDLGVSSRQLDDASRGFSFRLDGPLDMRMEKAGATATDAVNALGERALAEIIRAYGEERHAHRVARAIVERRRTRPIARTSELADIVRRVVPRARDGLDPATRTFQALRVHVNDELGELARGLGAAERLLATGGRLAVVSFHSLEDRKVKEFLCRRAGLAPRHSRHRPDGCARDPAPTFRLLGRGAVRPGAEEVAANARARSARLRAAERAAAPAWTVAAPAARERPARQGAPT